jgi:opacity protein-like surface antigen
MRRFLFAAAMMGAVSAAHAADLPVLRGGLTDGLNVSVVNWQGFYVGGQAGYGSSDENFVGSPNTLIAGLVQNNVIQQTGVAQWNLNLGKNSATTSGYGGFAGYNWQWTEAVLSAEVSYLHGSFGGATSASEGPLTFGPLSDTFFHTITATSTSSISISDIGTIRGRAGYAYNIFLPYAFAGFALGNADISQSVFIKDHYAPTFAGSQASCFGPTPPVCASLSASNDRHNHLIYGYSGGLGVDVNLTAGLFLRAEWEYIRFTTSVDTSINTVRAGLGYKF